MDGKVFFLTFGAVFLAELADKTQIVGVGMSAKTGKPISVWLGSVCAYMIVTVISVSLGMVVGKFMKPELVKDLGAIIFIGMGLLMLFKVI